MTGTQSLSIAQLRAVTAEIERMNGALDPDRWVEVESKGERVRLTSGEVVTVVVHQADRAWVHGRYVNVPERTQGADKRVQLHRVYADSRTIWLDRDGKILHTFG